MTIEQPLTDEIFALGLKELAGRDEDFAQILETLGTPPRWEREAGFPGLVQIILGQQVSVASAKAIYKRLCLVVEPMSPENFLKLDDLQLKSVGLSRQKAAYIRELAGAIATGNLNLEALAFSDETTIRNQLKRIKGIGDWTVDIYLLMSLQLADVFPASDLGIILGYQRLKNLTTRPTPNELRMIAENWRPWRAIAARIIWHYYLHG